MSHTFSYKLIKISKFLNRIIFYKNNNLLVNNPILIENLETILKPLSIFLKQLVTHNNNINEFFEEVLNYEKIIDEEMLYRRDFTNLNVMISRCMSFYCKFNNFDSNRAWMMDMVTKRLEKIMLNLEETDHIFCPSDGRKIEKEFPYFNLLGDLRDEVNKTMEKTYDDELRFDYVERFIAPIRILTSSYEESLSTEQKLAQCNRLSLLFPTFNILVNSREKRSKKESITKEIIDRLNDL